MGRWWGGVAGWAQQQHGFYTVQFEAGIAYADGAGEVHLLLDETSEVGATPSIFATDAGTGYRLVQLKAGLTVIEVSALFEWTPGGQNFGSGLVIVDEAFNVLVDGRFYSTFPGAGGAGALLEEPDLPYTMPVDGYLAMTFDNDMGNSVTTLGPNEAYRIEAEWAL